MITRSKCKALLIISAGLFLAVCIRNIYVLETEKVLPLLRSHDHFVLDFEYFYDMGMQSIACPSRLYSDPKMEGTPVLLLKRNVFHPYPPPAALLFRMFLILPFAYSYAVWSFLVYLIIVLVYLLSIKCLHGEFQQTKPEMWFPFILCISAAPTFIDSSFGNVNSLLLLLCVVYTWFFKHEKFIWAGVILSVAFWLKLYPAILFLTIFKTREKIKLTGSFLAGIFGVFIISLFFMPLDVYKEFFLEIAPAYSGQTITHVFNQSLTPAILRLVRGSTDIFFSYDYMIIPLEIRIATYIITLAALIVFCYTTWKYNASSNCIIAGLCNFIPLITPIGWGYTFVMLYPSLIILYYRGIMKSKVSFIIYLLCWFAIAIPSYHRIKWMHLPVSVQLMYYSRYTIASILLYCLHLFQIVKENDIPKNKITVNSCSSKLPVCHS